MKHLILIYEKHVNKLTGR